MIKNILKIALTLILCLNMTITTFALSPISTDRVSRDGRELMVKTFEISPYDNPQKLIEQDFVYRRFTFSNLEINTDEVISFHTREVSVSVDVETSNRNNIVSHFTPYIDYERDRMTGRLYLDTGSLYTRSRGFTTQNYTVSATRTFGGFRHNDPSDIPRTIVENGRTLYITGINWVVTGTELVGDSLLPSSFNAVVSYSGTASRRVSIGYITTATYRGAIEQAVVDRVIVTIIYEGTPLHSNRTWLWILLAVLGALLLLGGAAAWIYFSMARDVEIYNKHGDEYERIGREWIDFKNPVVNLLPHKRNAYTEDYLLMLSKKAVLELMGKDLEIRIENQTIRRKVDNDKIFIRESESD